MPESNDVNAALAELSRENAELRGKTLATGVILTQLLQSICKTQLNPHAFATKIMENAREAVDGFPPDVEKEYASAMKQMALDTVKQYEEQIQSVLPV